MGAEEVNQTHGEGYCRVGIKREGSRHKMRASTRITIVSFKAYVETPYKHARRSNINCVANKLSETQRRGLASRISIADDLDVAVLTFSEVKIIHFCLI